jgi:hypothetical protein
MEHIDINKIKKPIIKLPVLSPDSIDLPISPTPACAYCDNESLSPYMYCAGNPVNRIDPDVMDINFICHFKYDENRSDIGTWEKGISKETEKILEAFAKTKIGYVFFQ